MTTRNKQLDKLRTDVAAIDKRVQKLELLFSDIGFVIKLVMVAVIVVMFLIGLAETFGRFK